MKRNKVGRGEVTGKRAGRIAGTILRRLKELKIQINTPLYVVTPGGEVLHVCWVNDLEALAGTALTQVKDRKPVLATARRKRKK